MLVFLLSLDTTFSLEVLDLYLELIKFKVETVSQYLN